MKEIEKTEGDDITINEKSTYGETAEFLRKKFNFSEEAIDKLYLDGESFFMINREDIKDFPVSEESKEKLIIFFEKFIWKKEEKKELNNTEGREDNKEVNKVRLKSINFGGGSLVIKKPGIDRNETKQPNNNDILIEATKEIDQKFDGKEGNDKNKKGEKNCFMKILSKCFG